MPRSRGSAHARRRPHPPQKRGDATYLNYGVQAPDAISGVNHPLRLMVPQRGRLVVADYNYGSRDVVDEIDGHYQPPVQPAVPDPVYRLTFQSVRAVVTQDSDERDTLVGQGYRWTTLGFAYPRGDEETGLVPVYELFFGANGDHYYTATASEVTAAILAGYVNEGPAFYAFTTTGSNRRPLYRTVVGQSHWYTGSLPEYLARTTDTPEGIVCYLLTGAERSRA